LTRDLGRSVSTFSRSVKLFSTGDGCVPVKWSNLVLLLGHAKNPSHEIKSTFMFLLEISSARNVARREMWRTFHSKKINLISKMGKIVMFRGNVGIK